MRILSATFVDSYQDRILNIHPSLLPSFPGLYAQKQAIQARAYQTGCTVHIVDAGVDTGSQLLQRTVPVYSGDTEESLAARILVEEHIAYPEAVRRLLRGEFDDIIPGHS
jgi:phosphoribosylglycinamide formyltransferase-1